MKVKRPEVPQKLFSQVMSAAQPKILELWKEADRFFPAGGTNCPEEIQHADHIGKTYYQCNPHFWQCYWQGGVRQRPELEITLFGKTFHLRAKAAFNSRFYDLFKRTSLGLPVQYGYVVQMEIKEIPELHQTMILVDSCRDVFLPERLYGYGREEASIKEGFIWDNFDRNIFIDKFYVTNRQVNEWRRLTDKTELIEKDVKKWPYPALLSRKEQKDYCAFYGKRLLEAKLFDAASMPPAEPKNPLPDIVHRPQTPWHRDLSKTFLGMARINPDYQLTPLDCQLAQTQGCEEKLFSTDSATWMGIHFPLGFYPESLENFIAPSKNLKRSSRYFTAGSTVHELGYRDEWKGEQTSSLPVAFRCYEEVSL